MRIRPVPWLFAVAAAVALGVAVVGIPAGWFGGEPGTSGPPDAEPTRSVTAPSAPAAAPSSQPPPDDSQLQGGSPAVRLRTAPTAALEEAAPAVADLGAEAGTAEAGAAEAGAAEAGAAEAGAAEAGAARTAWPEIVIAVERAVEDELRAGIDARLVDTPCDDEVCYIQLGVMSLGSQEPTDTAARSDALIAHYGDLAQHRLERLTTDRILAVAWARARGLATVAIYFVDPETSEDVAAARMEAALAAIERRIPRRPAPPMPLDEIEPGSTCRALCVRLAACSNEPVPPDCAEQCQADVLGARVDEAALERCANEPCSGLRSCLEGL